jgi:tetratricopeptide (TPR) repeat protein
MRVRFQLAFAYYVREDYATAVQKFADAAQAGPPRADLLVDWGLSYAALHETDKALEKLREAAALTPTAHVYSQLGQVNGAASRWPEALEALNQAEKIDPSYALTYFYRGLVYYNTKQCSLAVQNYQRALALDPTTPDGITALRQASACAASH